MKEGEAVAALVVVGAGAKSAGNQLRRAVANEGCHELRGEFRAAHLAQHGVDGVDQVQLGIDQRAIQDRRGTREAREMFGS